MFDTDLHKQFKFRFCDEFAKHNILQLEVAKDMISRFLDHTGKDKNILFYGDYYANQLIANHFADANQVIYADVVQYQKTIACFEENFSITTPLDYAFSLLSLHFTNNLEMALSEYRRMLRAGGYFIAALCGRGSLWQLRQAMMKADEKHLCGIRNTFIPLYEPNQIINIAKKAGLKNIILELETYRLEYNNIKLMIDDIRKTGQGNCLKLRDTRLLNRQYLDFLELEYKKDHDKLILDYNVIFITCMI